MIVEVIFCVVVAIVMAAAAISLCGCGNRTRKGADRASGMEERGESGKMLSVPDRIVEDVEAASEIESPAATKVPYENEQRSITIVETKKSPASLALQSTDGISNHVSSRLAAVRNQRQLGNAKSLEMQAVVPQEARPSKWKADSSSIRDLYGTFNLTLNPETNPLWQDTARLPLGHDSTSDNTFGWMNRYAASSATKESEPSLLSMTVRIETATSGLSDEK